MKFLILFLIFFSNTLLAKEMAQRFSYEDFYKAKTATSFLTFEMKSTKLGMMTSSFTGAVKDFNVIYDLNGNILKTASVAFRVENLDTDVNDRNKKMYGLCFESKKYPDLIVTLNGPIEIGKTKKAVPATMNVRGKNKLIAVMLDVVKKGKKLIVTGVSEVTLSALEIPDPSIWVAKVKDEVEVKFNFELNL